MINIKGFLATKIHLLMHNDSKSICICLIKTHIVYPWNECILLITYILNSGF